jgi:hypothetical protein
MNLRAGMRCQICAQPILREEAKVFLPPFVVNQLDPLFKLSNGASHRRCYEVHASRADIEARLELAAAFRDRKHRCVVCARKIARSDLVTPGFITADRESPLFRFNYVTAHKEHLDQWEHYPTLKRLLEELQCSPAGGAGVR